MPAETEPRVAVLLATFQGRPFLAEQLDSIASSIGVSWFVCASDDGSTDGTRELLADYQQRWSSDRLLIRDGPEKGLSANFLSLVNDMSIVADAYAFADQDDVWAPEKLQRAAAWLRTIPGDVPALYCGRTRLIDERGSALGMSPEFNRPPAFANALTQNLASGNTMVFNEAARQLLRSTITAAQTSAVHDWWAYLIVTGAGGAVHYDRQPTVHYRQHAANQVGGAVSNLDRALNARDMFAGRFSRWNDQNEAALREARHFLTSENTRVFDAFCNARHGRLPQRLLALRRAGVYRQTRRGRLFVWTAALFNRL